MLDLLVTVILAGPSVFGTAVALLGGLTHDNMAHAPTCFDGHHGDW